jgi:hypothetical protein
LFYFSDMAAAVDTWNPIGNTSKYMPDLKRILNMTDVEYASFPKETKLQKLTNFLRIRATDLPAFMPKTIDGLRKLFKFTWIDQNTLNFDKDFLIGKVSCKYCLGDTLKSGDLTIHGSVLALHAIMLTEKGAKTKHALLFEKAIQEAAAASERAAAAASRRAATAASNPPDAVAASAHSAPAMSESASATGTVRAVRQQNIVEAGFRRDISSTPIPLREQAYPMAAALAIARAVPYSTTPVVFDQKVTTLVKEAASGCPQSRSLREKILPDLRTKIRDRIRQQVARRRGINVGCDGGSAPGLLGKEKMLAICLFGPSLEHDALVKIKFLGNRHETTENQAKALHDALTSVGATPEQVLFIIADNAAINQASVDYLNSHYGWNAEYRRCLPHCLNLIMVEVTQPFDDEYKISSFLSALRGLYNSGGGASNITALREGGVRLGQLDFTVTRWASLLKAVAYLVSTQGRLELEIARDSMIRTFYHQDEALKLSEESDRPATLQRIPELRRDLQETLDALEEPDVPQSIWCALFEVTESIKEKQAEDGRALKAARRAAMKTLKEGGVPADVGVRALEIIVCLQRIFI